MFLKDKICPVCGAIMKAGSTPTHKSKRFRIHYMYCEAKDLDGKRCVGRRATPESLPDNNSPNSLQNCKLE